MKKMFKRATLGLLICTVATQLCTYSSNSSNNKAYKISATTFTDEKEFSALETLASSNRNYVYLSDVPYISEQSGVGWGTITLDSNLDANANNGLIALNVDGKKKLFLKGISAHATSTLVYDISGLNYDYFSTYYGVDASRGTNGDGVKFSIYTSVDGKSWNLETPTQLSVKKGDSEAEYAKINIQGKNYIKLYCNKNKNDTADHCAYGNAKLYKDGYEETEEEQAYDFIKTLEEYDAILQNASYNEILTTKEQVLLQRKFVSNFGYDMLQAIAHLDSDKKETIEWLMTDLDALRYYVTGGNPTGSYINSINVLTDLYKAHKSDLNDATRTLYTSLGDLYKRMMISLSLTHSTNVCLWVGGNQCSDAVTRYEIYKRMHKNNLLTNKVFETLNIEEMRWVMNNNIDDEEIEWLNNHVRKTNNSWDPYTYIAYKDGYNYSSAQYYDLENYEKWDQKYQLSEYNITYQMGKPKLWIVFEQGAVCGGISKTGSNINGAFGNPSAVIGQPGHAAYLQYSETIDGKGKWTIYNDISGWTASEKSERLLAGWGSNSWDSYYQVSYVPYAQEALNDIKNYNKAKEIMALADLYPNDVEKLEEIYRQALNYQPINMDAWYGLITAYQRNNTKTAKDYMDLAQELADNMYYFPLPMFDLMNLIKGNLEGTIYAATFANYQRTSLVKGTQLNDSNSPILQPEVTRTMANYLLGHNDFTVATFSFDGTNAKKIVLGSKYQGNNVRWDYSLDGGKTWKETSESFVLLSDEEIESITIENDIKIHMVGVDYSPKNIYTIDITKGTLPIFDNKITLYANDKENRVVGVDFTMEWRMNQNEEWTSYAKSSPNLSGDTSVQVRVGATGTNLPSDYKVYTFTQDPETEPTRKYVYTSRLSISGVSSEAISNSQRGDAIYAIDGNYNTRWHSSWDGTDTDKWIIIKLDRPITLSALEYIPADGGNGRILEAKIYGSLDGENFDTEIGHAIWDNNMDTKNYEFEDKPQVQYIKIVGINTTSVSSKSFIAARMFNIYEDATRIPEPTASIAYSTLTPTNGEVVARLVNFSVPNIKIIGSDTYTFTENGSHTFRFIDTDTNLEGTATATVNWIDREAPTATIKYSTTNPTSNVVIATLIPSEDVTVLNNGFAEDLGVGEESNSNTNPFTYTFMENGSFTFKFKDRAGNIGTATATVDWIDNAPIHALLTYDINELTNKDVTVTIEFDKENVTILNNYGKNTYTFVDNDSFMFYYKDDAGNVGTKLAYVNWIDKVAPNAKITYTITDPTEGPVTAVISSNEVIKITNNGGQATYTFTENGRFEFTYEDALGNKGKVGAQVDWILTDEANVLETKVNTNYVNYSLVDVTVSIPEGKIEEEVTLKKSNFSLPNSLKQKFNSNSEYFELYLENNTKEKISLPSTEVKIAFDLNPSKKFLGIYEVLDDGSLNALDYQLKGNKVEVKTEDLGRYIVSYEAKKVVKKDNTTIEEVKESNMIVWVIVGGVLLAMSSGAGTIFMKKRKK